MKFEQIKKLPTEIVLMHYFASVDKTDLLTLDDYYKYFELIINDKENLPTKEELAKKWKTFESKEKSNKRIDNLNHSIALTESLHEEALLFFESKLQEYRNRFYQSLEAEDWSRINDFAYGHPRSISYDKSDYGLDYTYIATRGCVMSLFKDQQPEALYLYFRDGKKVNDIFKRVESHNSLTDEK